MSAEGCATISVKKVSGARPDRRELLKLQATKNSLFGCVGNWACKALI